jgi:DNA-binding transcriptional MocR family regulator
MARGRLAATALIDLLGDWRGDAPAYEALAERVRLLVIDGRISTDVRLPSERELSERLALSRTTITAAYRLLRETGYARSVQGSGTTTTMPLLTSELNRRHPALVNLAMATLPATGLMPEAVTAASHALPAHYATPGYHLVGTTELREALARRFTDRGLPTEPDEILVTTGGQSAIALLARSLVTRGDRVYAESPSYPHAYDALRDAGARIVTSPVDTETGWDIASLTSTIARTAPTLAYVMPDFHNPTGRSMTLEDRHALLEAAARVDAVVIADETTADLDIDSPDRHGPLGSLADDHRARVVHVGSAGKLMWGGLRVGWIRASREILSRVAGLRPASDLGTPVWEQLVVAHLLPRADEIIDERRAQLLERRGALYQSVKQHLPEWDLPSQIHGGLAAWAKLPAPVSSQLTLAARAAGLENTAGPRFGTDGAYERYIRLPLTPEPTALTQAIELLGTLWPAAAQRPDLGVTLSDRMV